MSRNKDSNKGVHVVYKNLGETSNEAILRFKNENIENTPELDFLPVTYAGRLDPMAEGLLLLLSGENVHNKEKFLDLPKTYEFEILWGFETDSLDVLGMLVKSEDLKFPTKVQIEKYLNDSIGKFEQLYPAYSSRPVNGKSLFQWAREGKIKEIEIPKHEVEITYAKFLDRREISGKDLLEEIISKISKVSGDFRQKESIELWKKNLKGKEKKNFTVDKLELKVSSGFYVRQFVFDLAKKIETLAVTYHIKRIKVGDFSID